MSAGKILKRKTTMLLGCCLLIIFSMTFTLTGAFCQIPGAEKSPQEVIDSIETGQPQDLIVLFDDSAVENDARTLRAALGVSHDTDYIVAEKAMHYKRLKQRAIDSFSYEDAEVLRDYSHLPMVFMRVKSPAGLAQLLERSDIVRVYQNMARTHFLAQSLPLINQPFAASSGRVGTGTTVAVLDTGVDYTRAAFGSCTAPGIPAGCKVTYARDFAPDDGSLDDDGHGTNVAGIVLGVAPDTRIAALDVFRTDGYAYDADIINALNWCIANKSAYTIQAINMSLGGGAYTSPCTDDPFATPIANARSAGILSAIASGNNGYANRISSPACVPGAVSVGAVYDSDMGALYWSSCTDLSTYADKITCFSNSAYYLTILAPGAIINAAGITMAGTSQATPHIAGAIAVLRGAGAFPSDTVDQTVARMTGTGVSVTDTRNGITKPRIDLQASLESQTYSISGKVRSSDLVLMQGVTMTLSGDASATTTTDSLGRYRFTGLANGAYTVTPSFTGYAFTPASRSITISGADATRQHFTGTISSGGGIYSISGKIRTSTGSLMAGVTVTLSGSASATTTTDSLGRYRFTGLANGAYTVTPSFTGYAFTPASRSITISGADATRQHFTGYP